MLPSASCARCTRSFKKRSPLVHERRHQYMDLSICTSHVEPASGAGRPHGHRVTERVAEQCVGARCGRGLTMGSSNTFFSESHTAVPGCRRGERRPGCKHGHERKDESFSTYARFVTGSHTAGNQAQGRGVRTTRRIIFYRDTARGRQGHGAVCLRAAAFGGDRFEPRRSLRKPLRVPALELGLDGADRSLPWRAPCYQQS
jgi:hypothetical protein